MNPESLEAFDIYKSPMREAYILLDATTPFELSQKYTKEEQILFKSHTWDYEDPNQIQNKVKEILESTDVDVLTEEEKEWRQHILWFWYHHAISVSDWKRDKEKMKEYSSKALDLLDSSNILTRTMYLLCHDDIEEAEQWVESKKGDPDEEIARDMVNDYKRIGWLFPGLE